MATLIVPFLASSIQADPSAKSKREVRAVTPEPNAAVEYIDEKTRAVVFTDKFYDPGFDENSWMARDAKRDGRWHGPHLTYGCGKRLR